MNFKCSKCGVAASFTPTGTNKFSLTYARFLRLMITSAIDQLTTDPGGHPVLIILDEFARLEQLPAVSNAFGFAAGYNLQLWPFLQDLPQLQKLYGSGWMSVLPYSQLKSMSASSLSWFR